MGGGGRYIVRAVAQLIRTTMGGHIAPTKHIKYIHTVTHL